MPSHYSQDKRPKCVSSINVVQPNLNHLYISAVVSLVSITEVTEQPLSVQLPLVQISCKVLIMYHGRVIFGLAIIHFAISSPRYALM